MADLRWTEEAAAWLEDIYQYIAEDSPEAARRVVEGIYHQANLLTRFPAMGYKYRDVDEGEIRVLLYGHYRIAYLCGIESRITILGVFHGALDIERFL